jgi:NAD(P)H-dependent FMN reductase
MNLFVTLREDFMQTRKILTLVGGISRNSLNKKLFHAVEDLVPDDFEIITTNLEELPFFSQDLENDPPDKIVAYKELIREADAFLFISPEYNRSFPGVLKNGIDWGSRPYGQNLWKNKPAAVMGASPGNIGTFGAQHHLRQVLAYLEVPVMGQPEFYLKADKCFDQNGQLTDPKVKDLITNFWKSFAIWIDSMNLTGETGFHLPKSRGLEDSPLIL